MIEKVLAIETSCDDTSVALLRNDGWVIDQISANQDRFHQKFGGVVPEIAGRRHTEDLLPLIDLILRENKISWNEIGGIAVTSEPGLLGSLLVGVVTAKTLSLAKKIPLIGVNHIEGHMVAAFLRDKEYAPKPNWGFPCLALVVSGGHSLFVQMDSFGEYKKLGGTIDDAAGEAFDKFAKMLNLGYPGGVHVDRLAQKGNPTAFDFPRAKIHGDDSLDLSFSGLKTSALNLLKRMVPQDISKSLPDLCASYQEAIVDALLIKLERCQKLTKAKNITVTGGVSANSRLRYKVSEWCKKNDLHLEIPPLKYCTDNAAMIGYAGLMRLQRGERSDLSLAPKPASVFLDV